MKKTERKAIPTHLASLPKMNNYYNCGISFPLKKCFIYVQKWKHTTHIILHIYLFKNISWRLFLSRVYVLSLFLSDCSISHYRLILSGSSIRNFDFNLCCHKQCLVSKSRCVSKSWNSWAHSKAQLQRAEDQWNAH